jgi:hypothetical protein
MAQRKANAQRGAKATATVAVPGQNSARLTLIPALVSIVSFFYYFRHSDLLLYGDAVAHINIARRVFDSQTPGLLQLGTVWLPLPHLLMIPFVWPNTLWQSGVGGSIPSMIAYVLGVIGVYRLVGGMLGADAQEKPMGVVGAATAALVYGANPNLIYMQATAMTESVYLALFIWAVAYFAEFLRSVRRREQTPDSPLATKLLRRCALCLAGAELTRYDGWFFAGVIGVTIAVVVLRHWNDRIVRLASFKFLLAISLAPVLWLAYNAAIYRNPLEFANGPSSARAIEQRVGAPNPALHHAGVAALYFLKSAQLNMTVGNWGRFWLLASVLALAVAIARLRSRSAPLLLLWVPVAFYALSIAYGSVPIHVSTWWPFVPFNQRYGLQLLPMFAVSAGVLTATVSEFGIGGRHGGKLVAVTLALVIASYASVWRAGPQCFQEAQKQWNVRSPLNTAVQRTLTRLPRDSMYLMDLGEHVGVMEQAGIPLRQVVNTENRRPWKRWPQDPDSLWERSLADPARYVDFVIVFDGDAVDRGLNRSNLTDLIEFHATGQPHARIYATHVNATQSAPNQSR